GLYLKTLTEGLSAIPDVPAATRRRLAARLVDEGAPALHDELGTLDPETAARIAPNDSQRILRALEVLEATGRPLTHWQTQPGTAMRGVRIFTILVLPPRDALYAACDRRLAAMVEAGALDEVRRLTAMRLDPTLPAMKALGVREFAAHLAGNCDLEAALSAARQATRRYAKRQMTWFRHQIVAELTLPAQYSKSLLPETFAFIRPKLLTRAG
ncbi:MAG: tRNA (adenosine(37)-N6)-dimethylallyltransferase MiaA, partial [Rhodospirillales bacterium]